jgi:hypothetical protein
MAETIREGVLTQYANSMSDAARAYNKQEDAIHKKWKGRGKTGIEERAKELAKAKDKYYRTHGAIYDARKKDLALVDEHGKDAPKAKSFRTSKSPGKTKPKPKSKKNSKGSIGSVGGYTLPRRGRGMENIKKGGSVGRGRGMGAALRGGGIVTKG